MSLSYTFAFVGQSSPAKPPPCAGGSFNCFGPAGRGDHAASSQTPLHALGPSADAKQKQDKIEVNKCPFAEQVRFLGLAVHTSLRLLHRLLHLNLLLSCEEQRGFAVTGCSLDKIWCWAEADAISVVRERRGRISITELPAEVCVSEARWAVIGPHASSFFFGFASCYVEFGLSTSSRTYACGHVRGDLLLRQFDNVLFRL